MTAPNETEDLLQRGIAAARGGRADEARRLLMQVVERDERNEQAWLWLSGAVDSNDDRRVCLENVLALHPGHPAALAGLRFLGQTPGSPIPAQPGAGTTTEQAPPDAGEICPHCDRPVPPFGNSCPHCGGPLLVACPACGEYATVEQSSCADCGQHLGDYRSGAAYFLSLAEASLAHGRHHAVEHALNNAESRAGDDASTLVAIAGLYEQLGLLDRAAAAAEHAVAAAPKDATAHIRLGSIYQREGKRGPAQAAVRQAAELSKDPAVHMELARVYLCDEATVADAVALLQSMIKSKPMNAQAHLLLGDAYLKLHTEGRALHAYQDAARLAPADSKVGLEARSRLAQYQASSTPATSDRTQRSHRPARQLGERPGCLTLYAIWLGFSGAMAALGALALFAFGPAVLSEYVTARGLPQFDLAPEVLWVATAISGAIALVYFLLAYGLWTMRNWARISVLVLSILGLLGSIAQTVASLTGMREVAAQMGLEQMSGLVLCGPILEFAVSGYIIFWFWANRDVFS